MFAGGESFNYQRSMCSAIQELWSSNLIFCEPLFHLGICFAILHHSIIPSRALEFSGIYHILSKPSTPCWIAQPRRSLAVACAS